MNFRNICISCAVGIFVIYVGLIASLYPFYSAEKMLQILSSARTIYALQLSIAAATAVTVFSVLAALPAAFALSRYDFTGKKVIDTILELPLFVSPAALGAMILIFFNTPLGVWVQANVEQFVFTVYGVLLAQLVAVMGISVRLIKAVFDQIPSRYEEVARTLGASLGKAFLLLLYRMLIKVCYLL